MLLMVEHLKFRSQKMMQSSSKPTLYKLDKVDEIDSLDLVSPQNKLENGYFSWDINRFIQEQSQPSPVRNSNRNGGISPGSLKAKSQTKHRVGFRSNDIDYTRNKEQYKTMETRQLNQDMIEVQVIIDN